MKKYLPLLFTLTVVNLFGQQIKEHLGSPKPVEYKEWQFTLPLNYQERITEPSSSQAPAVQPINLKTANYSEHLGLEVVERTADRPTIIRASHQYKQPHHKSFADLADHFLQTASPLMGFEDASQAFEMVHLEMEEGGLMHYKMQHHYKGVPVWGSEIILHGERNQITTMNGRYLEEPNDLEVTPAIPLQESQQTLIDQVGVLEVENDDMGLFDYEKIQSELVIYPTDQGYRLAYHHTIHPAVAQRWEYFVDAQDGTILDKYESICRLHNHGIEAKGSGTSHHHTIGDFCQHKVDQPRAVDSHRKLSSASVMNGPATVSGIDLFGRTVDVESYEVDNTLYMIDATKVNIFSSQQSNMPDEPVGAIWTIDGNNRPYADRQWSHVFTQSSTWNNRSAAVSAHVNGSEAFDYFEEKFGRRSINGSGGNIISLVNILDEQGNGLDNAFWDGQIMYYGGGRTTFLPLARALDVAAHEMSHGVIQNTANLAYQGQSGSLNESFADIFGAMVDRDDWLIGEDVIRPEIVSSNQYPLGALRSMEDPNNGINESNPTYQTVGRGWQPKHMNEFFDDVQNLNQGGVHINSGIPNHAYYLFAEEVGKDVAEQVYYRALTSYLTRSSQFVDARAAVLLAAESEGQDVVDAAAAAWAAVGIGAATSNPPGPSVCEDLQTNPGTAYIMVTDNDRTRLDLFDEQGNWLTSQATLNDVAPLTRPSITDDGSTAIYVGTDNRIYLISFDWMDGSFTKSTFQNDPVWRNVVISKDGRLIAATTTAQDNRVIIYDAVSDTQEDFFLYNPTFTQGVDAGEVNYSDAMEFDHSGQTLLYDAFNTLQGTNGSIEFWDIGLMNVWDAQANTFGDGTVQKIFTGLSEGESVGNPTFSKNSACVIAFDYIRVEDNQPLYSLWAANIEDQELGVLYENLGLSWPSYSPNDRRVVHDISLFGDIDLGVIDLQDNKVDPLPNSEQILVQGARLGVYFATGQRSLVSDLTEIQNTEQGLAITPNPTTGIASLSLDIVKDVQAEVIVQDILGKVVYEERLNLGVGQKSVELDLTSMPAGQYVVSVRTETGVASQQLIKM